MADEVLTRREKTARVVFYVGREIPIVFLGAWIAMLIAGAAQPITAPWGYWQFVVVTTLCVPLRIALQAGWRRWRS